MFETFNLIKFGKYLKELRLSLSYTQKYVEKVSGISIDTLRRIKNGKVLLRYDTLVHLSQVYKKDLLNDLRNYGSSNDIFYYYNKVDDLIFTNDIESLNNLKDDFKKYCEYSENILLISSYEQKQFELFVDAICEYSLDNKEKCSKSCIEALNQTYADLTIDNIVKYNFTHFELWIVLILALSTASLNDIKKSNTLLKKCLNQSNLDNESNINEKIFITRIYVNLAYNAHIEDNYESVIEYAEKGINYSIESNVYYSFPMLLYRKGIAEFQLNNSSYLSSLKRSISFLLATNNNKLAKLYVEITKDKYNIEINLEEM